MREACGGQTADVLTTCLSSMSSRDPDQPTSSPSHESAPVARGAAFLVPQIAATWKWATSRIFLQSSPSPSSQVHMLKQDGILPPTTQAERPPASGEPLTQGAHEEPRIPIGLPALHQAVASSPAAMQPPIHPASMLPHEGTSTPPAMESAHVRWAAKRSRSMARRQGLFEHVQTIYLSTTEVPPLQGPVWGRPPRPPPLVMVAPCALGERSGPDGDETDTDEEVCLPRPEEEWLPRPLVKTKMKPRCFGPILEKLPEEQPVSQLPPGWTQVLLHRVRCGTAYTVVRTTCTHCGQVLT